MLLSHFMGERRASSRPDPVKQDVERRQWIVARRISRITGQAPAELMDYARADRILSRR